MAGIRWGALLASLLLLAGSSQALLCLAGGTAAVSRSAATLLPGGTLVVSAVAFDAGLPPGERIGCVGATAEPPSDVSLQVEGQSSHDSACLTNGSSHLLRLDAPRASGVLVLDWNGTPVRVPYRVAAGQTANLGVELTQGHRSNEDPVQGHVSLAGTELTEWGGRGVAAGWVVLGAAQALAFLAVLLLLLAGTRLRWAWWCLGAAALLLLPAVAQEVRHVEGWWVLAAALLLVVHSLWSWDPHKAPSAGPPAPPPGPPTDPPAVPSLPPPSLDAIGLREDLR